MALSGAGCYHGLSRGRKRPKSNRRRFWGREPAPRNFTPAIDLKTPGSSRSSNYQPTGSSQIAKTKRNQQIQMPIKTVLRHLPAIIFRLWLWWPVRKVKWLKSR